MWPIASITHYVITISQTYDETTHACVSIQARQRVITILGTSIAQDKNDVAVNYEVKPNLA